MCADLLYACMMKTTSLIPYSEERNREGETERERENKICSVSLSLYLTNIG